MFQTFMLSADENRETWKQVSEFVGKVPDNAHWNRWKDAVSPVLERAMDSGFDSIFRAGTSVSDIVFSTADHHGLHNQPRITLTVTKERKLRISFSTRNVHFYPPTQFEILEPAAAFPAFTKYLQLLWQETIHQPIPELLKAGEGQ